MTKKCPNCHLELKPAEVLVEETVKYECEKCAYAHHEPKESRKEMATKGLSPLTLRQKITTLAQGRLGLYLSQDVVRSLKLKAGQEVHVSVPDEKTLMIKLV